MDNNVDIEYSIIEEKYINDCAKYNIGDVVYYENNNHEMSIGIIHERLIVRKPIIRNKTKDKLIVIGYKIIHPKGVVLITEPFVTSASQYIFREYLNHKQPN